jgi:hypothetical protein
MSEISVVVVGSTNVNSTVGNNDVVNVNVGNQTVGGGGGAAATIEAGTVTMLDSTQTATITNVGSAYAAKFNFAIPRGNTGQTGPANSLSVGSVSAGTAAAVSISGAAPSQTLSFVVPQGPAGPANSLSIGSVVGGATAAVTISGAAPSQTLSFVLPHGPVGAASSLVIGTVVTGADAAATLTGAPPAQILNLVLPQGATGVQGIQGEVGPAGPASSLTVAGVTTTTATTASVSITGTSPSQQISFVIPQGPRGLQGEAGPFTTIQAGSVATGAAGTAAKIDTVTSGGTVTLNFTIPRGVDGTANLADETPQPLGVARAGSALSAARADHVHAVPVIAYGNLTGVPSTFAPAAHQHAMGDVTGLQAALDGKQASGAYVTLDGSGRIPSSVLPSYVDDIIEAATFSALTALTGEGGKLYVTVDTRKLYRWSGSAFVEIASSPGSTDAVTEGATNLYFTTARASAAAPVQSVNGKVGDVVIEAGGIAWSTVPTATTTVTKAGALSYDENYLYVANAASQWRRTSIEDWTTPTISISVQPSSQTAVSGTATFTVTATATQNAELLYQWQRQAGGAGSYVNIATGVSATLSLESLSFAANNGDKYRVIITSGAAGTGGSSVNGWYPAVVVELTPTATITSGEATLTVAAAISIVAQPQNVTLTNGTSASFAVSATTPGTELAYQWQSSPDGTNWTNASGATSASYALTELTETGYSGLRYRCIVSSSGYPDATSNAATLTVAPISVTSQPASQTGQPVAGTTPNYSASFTSAASSPAGAPTIQWEVSADGGTTFSDLSGQTNSSLALTGLTNSDTGKRYRAKFQRSGWNTVRSSAATLTVPTDVITVTQQPSNTTAIVSDYSAVQATLPTGAWNSISLASGRWFATPSNTDFGGDYIATSADGINWRRTNLALPAADRWSEVLYYGGVYLTYRGSGTPRYATSTDGVNWTGRSSVAFNAAINGLHSMRVHSAVGFVLVNSSTPSSTASAVSSDGINWSPCPGGGFGTQQLTIGNRTVATSTSWIDVSGSAEFGIVTQVGVGTPVYTPVLSTSQAVAPYAVVRLSIAGDYIQYNWSLNNSSTIRLLSFADASSTTPTVLAPGNLPTGQVLSVLPRSPRWVAAGTAGFFTSNDQGQTWVLRQSQLLPSNGNGRFYTTGNRISFTNFPSTTSIYTSDDGGFAWTTRSGSPAAGSQNPVDVGNSVMWPDAAGSSRATIISLGGLTSATFSSAATTTFGSPSIQWQQSSDGGANWANISAATSSSLSLTPVSGDSGKRFRAVYSKDSYATVNSNPATLTVP